MTSMEYKKAQRLYLKSTKNRPPNVDQDWSPFRAAEKKFKARFPPVDLSGVLDLALSSPNAVDISTGDRSPRAYTIPQVPGLVILPSFLSEDKQRELVQWALARHARSPNETNLDVHYLLPQDGLWNSWLAARKGTQDFLIHPRTPIPELVDGTPPGPRQLINNPPASPESFQAISMTPKPPLAPSLTTRPTATSALLPKLRWANIGWYYHWGTKQYDFTKGKGVIDDELRSVCKAAVKAVDWEKVHGSTDVEWGPGGPDWDTWEETYEPDAGIVNFYQEKDTLMAHVDRSEVCATSPLVSISLGNAAIFLIGGLTRNSEPTPILLRSGDVVIMSGPACRRAYHGVPRVLAGTLPPHMKAETFKDRELEKDWQPYEDYLSKARININVRQVFPKGFNPNIESKSV